MQPPVDLELLLARAAGLADAAALALQVGPAAHQPRRQVLELRELDLQLAFAASRALREDVQDQLGAVEHAAVQRRFSRLRCCAGDSAWLKITYGRRLLPRASRISSTLPLPAKSAGSGRSRRR